MGTQHMMQACAPHSPAGPGSMRTTMCRWVPAVFSQTPNPTAACSTRIVRVFLFFVLKKCNRGDEMRYGLMKAECV